MEKAVTRRNQLVMLPATETAQDQAALSGRIERMEQQLENIAAALTTLGGNGNGRTASPALPAATGQTKVEQTIESRIREIVD